MGGLRPLHFAAQIVAPRDAWIETEARIETEDKLCVPGVCVEGLPPATGSAPPIRVQVSNHPPVSTPER